MERFIVYSKKHAKISDLIFDDRISARRFILYVYTIQLYGYAIQNNADYQKLPQPEESGFLAARRLACLIVSASMRIIIFFS